MSLLEKGVQYFQERRRLEKIHVEELGEDVFYYPAMNMAERREIHKYKAPDGTFDLEGLVMTLITRARDADGKRIFSKPDRLKLMREWDCELIARIVTKMHAPEADLEGAEKNS